MNSGRDEKDIEIIPPGAKPRRDREDWVYVSFGDDAKDFRDLPLHKRIMIGATWLAGIAVFGLIVFLIVASAVLIWIPLFLAVAVVTALIVFFRSRFRRR
jgi:hypothetical protein